MSEHDGATRPATGDGTGPIERSQGNNRVFAGRYRLLARRGRATDVALFEAVDEHTGRTVAVKIVHPEICARPAFTATSVNTGKRRPESLSSDTFFWRMPNSGSATLEQVGPTAISTSLDA